jgi:hypothetical protein
MMSCLCPVLSCRVVSCRVLPCLALSCLVLSCLVLSRLALSRFVLSCDILHYILDCVASTYAVYVMTCYIDGFNRPQVVDGCACLYCVLQIHYKSPNDVCVPYLGLASNEIE